MPDLPDSVGSKRSLASYSVLWQTNWPQSGRRFVALDTKNESLPNLFRARGCSRHRLDDHAFRLSVVNWLNTKSLESLKAVLHGFERFGGVPLPIRDLARDP
jgi:hypothetical protein